MKAHAVLKTRYRDIPWSKIHASHSMMPPQPAPAWDAMRGREITISLAPVDLAFSCGGPWFEVLDGPFDDMLVCPHLAELD